MSSRQWYQKFGNNKGTRKGREGGRIRWVVDSHTASPLRNLQRVDWHYKVNPYRELAFYVPETCVTVICEQAKPLWQWKYFYAISQVQQGYFQWVANKKNGFYVPVSSYLLDRVLGSKYYAQILRDLVDWGILKPPRYGQLSIIDGECTSTKNSYAFEEIHRSKTAKLVYENPSRALKVQEFKQAHLEEVFSYSPNSKHLFESMTKTTIEAEAAMGLIDDIEEATAHMIDSHRRSVEHIHNGNLYLSADYKTGRLFMNVSNLWKDLRPFLRLEGETLVEFDISNSQPTFAVSLYPSDSQERESYVSLVRSGKFYETLGALTGREYGSRKNLKKQVFKQVFFGSISDGTRRPLLRAFKQLFPELLAIIDELKEEDKNRFALKLQELEADLMIGVVIGRLQYLNILCLSVHDSVLCKKSDRATVKSIVEQELEQSFGFPAAITETDLSEALAA